MTGNATTPARHPAMDLDWTGGLAGMLGSDDVSLISKALHADRPIEDARLPRLALIGRPAATRRRMWAAGGR